MKKTIAAGPVAPGTPYSPAVLTGNTLYVSGQLPLDAAGQMPEDVAGQTRCCMENVKALVEQAGFTMADVVKTTVYMTDFSKFGEMNAVYAGFFSGVMPARCACQVSGLAKGAGVEIDCIAVKD